MKQPDDIAIGSSRKTLPSRKARKVQKSSAGKPHAAKKAFRELNADQELLKAFGER